MPLKRGNGYAKQALKQFLQEVRGEELPFIEITTDPTNVASRRVIEANGGALVEQFIKSAQHGGKPGLRYRIAFQ